MSKPHEFQQWLEQTAAELHEEPVPNWPREATFRPQSRVDNAYRESKAWWQKPWLPVTSLAASAFAMILVLGQVQIQSNQYGFSVSFGGADEAKLEAIIAERLNQYGAQQQVILANYANTLRSDFRDDFRTEMAQANQQLADYMLAVNRQERESDLAELIRYVNEQRQDDQYYFANQLQQYADGWVQQVGYSNQ